LKIQTKVTQGDYTKVLDLTTLYNFYKGSMVFCSTDFAETTCQLGDSLDADEQCRLALTRILHQFQLQI
jgi:hypothetical protein